MGKHLSGDLLADGSLVLTLDDACIRTAAKRAHGELVAALLEERASDAVAEALVDLLAQFLSATDFASLRAEHPELAGGTRCRVRLFYGEKSAVRWEVMD